MQDREPVFFSVLPLMKGWVTAMMVYQRQQQSIVQNRATHPRFPRTYPPLLVTATPVDQELGKHSHWRMCHLPNQHSELKLGY